MKRVALTLNGGKFGKFCCHLFKIKFEQVLIYSFNESLLCCMCLCIGVRFVIMRSNPDNLLQNCFNLLLIYFFSHFS